MVIWAMIDGTHAIRVWDMLTGRDSQHPHRLVLIPKRRPILNKPYPFGLELSAVEFSTYPCHPFLYNWHSLWQHFDHPQ
jgi:hypothetical protein